MQWWCSALGTPWSWTWRPYPGVWLFVLALLLGCHALRRRAQRPPGRKHAHVVWLGLGVALVWVALDWPVGALGGYLASAHMTQFLLLALTSPPLILLGIYPAAGFHDVAPGPAAMGDPAGLNAVQGWAGRPASWRGPAGRVLGHPLVAIAIFGAVVILTHIPVVTDRLMPSQAGSFAIDIAWLAGGLLFWWPVVSPGRPAWFGTPLRIVYLFANMVLMTAPGAMITFSELPIYATFELAPPIPGITPINDQRLAGLNMRAGAALASLLAISILFVRWNRDEERQMREEAEAVRTVS
jgi:cytochrome c oxidase assembly factor CtaG